MKRERLVKDSLLYIPSVIGPAIVGAAGLILLTRLLTPSQYGEYAISLAALTAITATLGDWLVPATIRFYPEHEQARTMDKLLVVLTALAGVAATLSAVVIFAVLAFVTSSSFVVAAAASAIPLVFAKVVYGILRAKLRTAMYSFLSMLLPLVSLGTGVGLYLLTHTAAFLVGSMGIAAVVSVLLFLPAILRRFKAPGVSDFKRPELKAVLSFGAPIAITSVSAYVLLLADRYVLGIFRGVTAVGLYSPNYSISEKIIGMSFAPLFNAVYPLATRAWVETDRSEALRYLQAVLRMYVIISGYLATILAVYAGLIVSVVLDPSFGRGASVVGIVAFGTAVFYIGVLFHQGMELAKLTGRIAILTGATAAVHVCLTLILIPIMGIMGAAWATLGSYATYCTAAYFWGRRTIGSQISLPISTLIRVGCFSLFIFLSRQLVSTRIEETLLMVATAPLYVAWLMALKEPGMREILAIVKRFREKPA